MSRDKIAKMLPLLASDKDGEVVAAARAITRALPGAGFKDWHDLAAALLTPVITTSPYAPPRGYQDFGFSAPPQPRAQRKSEDFHGGVMNEGEQLMLRQLFENHYRELTERDKEFIVSLRERVNRYGSKTFITPAQRKWLLEIYARVL